MLPQAFQGKRGPGDKAQGRTLSVAGSGGPGEVTRPFRLPSWPPPARAHSQLPISASHASTQDLQGSCSQRRVVLLQRGTCGHFWRQFRLSQLEEGGSATGI